MDVRPYWRAEFDPAASAGRSFEALAEEFRGLLRDAVRTELDDGKAGCFLSGGTDSSTVAGMIRAVTGRQPATYSIGFDAEGYDEMAFARIAARHFDTEHHEYYVTPADLVRSIPFVAAGYDQPFGNSSALPAYYCARMAARRRRDAASSPATAATSCSAATPAMPSSASSTSTATCRPGCAAGCSNRWRRAAR